jgi:hypothetical protein
VAAAPTLDIPRSAYGLKVGVAVLAGLVLAAVVAAAMGGDGRAVRSAVLAVAVGSALTFLPALLRISAEYWGVAVLASGVARSLLVLAIAYAMSKGNGDLAVRPFFVGALVGAVTILMAESALAVATLARWDRQRLALKNSGTDACP